jgi:tetratricopeptide (TPR) repeat protein
MTGIAKTSIVALLLAASLGLAQEQAEPSQAEKELAQLTAQVEQAQTVQEAARAFAKGRTIEPYHLPLLEAYMVRMMQLRQERIALTPARMILLVEPNHATALSLISFYTARGGEYPLALEMASRGLLRDRDDPSLLYNMGQLLAWYDRQVMPPRLDNGVLRRIRIVRQSFQEDPIFQKAYQGVQATYQRQEKLTRKLQEELSDEEKRYQQLNQQIMAIQADLRDVQDQISEEEAQIRLLHAQRWYNRSAPNVVTVYRRYPSTGVYVNYDGTWIRGSGYVTHSPGTVVTGTDVVHQQVVIGTGRDDVFEEAVREVKRQIDRLEDQEDDLQALGRSLLPEWRRLGNKLGKMRQAVDQVTQAVERRLAWEPPTIGEKVIDLDAPAPIVPPKPQSPEVRANSYLKLAQLYADNGFHQQARRYARMVLEEYRDTPSAPEAARLLGQLEAEE